jgi:hypothetical protein
MMIVSNKIVHGRVPATMMMMIVVLRAAAAPPAEMAANNMMIEATVIVTIRGGSRAAIDHSYRVDLGRPAAHAAGRSHVEVIRDRRARPAASLAGSLRAPAPRTSDVGRCSPPHAGHLPHAR